VAEGQVMRGGVRCQRRRHRRRRRNWVTQTARGDAKSSLGDATSSLGDAESSLGDANISLGEANISLGDARRSRGAARGLLRSRRARPVPEVCAHPCRKNTPAREPREHSCRDPAPAVLCGSVGGSGTSSCGCVCRGRREASGGPKPKACASC
jgi:hypothetical protein